MKIGVISDTHDNVPKIAWAVQFFNHAGVEAVLHCGDFVAPFALLPFKQLRPPLYLVFGNNDGERAGLAELATAHSWTLGTAPMELTLDGRRVLMLHEPYGLEEYRQAGKHDLIVYGHTHRPRTSHEAGRLVLNPGEGGGWLSGKASLAVVDLTTMEVVFHDIGAPADNPVLL